MRALFYLSLFMLVYGSLYPFTYGFTPLDQINWLPDPSTVSKADILGNVALCMPAGFFAALYPNDSKGWFILRLFMTVLFAVLVQFAQIFIAARVPSMLDVVFNLAGLGIGLVLALMVRGIVQRFASQPMPPAVFLLIAAFLIYQLIPFVPSLDWGLIKDNLKAILAASHQFSLGSFLRNAVYWFVTGALLLAALPDPRQPGMIKWVLALGILGTFAARVIILNNTPTPSQFLGGCLGILIFLVTTKLHERRLGLASLAIVLLLIHNGITPFEARPHAAGFALIPFQGFLSGSMFVNIQSLAWKLFLYGSLIYLLNRQGLRFWLAGLITAAFLALLELAQTQLASGSPEITDPIIALILAAILPTLTLRDQATNGYREKRI